MARTIVAGGMIQDQNTHDYLPWAMLSDGSVFVRVGDTWGSWTGGDISLPAIASDLHEDTRQIGEVGGAPGVHEDAALPPFGPGAVVRMARRVADSLEDVTVEHWEAVPLEVKQVLSDAETLARALEVLDARARIV